MGFDDKWDDKRSRGDAYGRVGAVLPDRTRRETPKAPSSGLTPETTAVRAYDEDHLRELGERRTGQHLVRFLFVVVRAKPKLKLRDHSAPKVPCDTLADVEMSGDFANRETLEPSKVDEYLLLRRQ